MYRIENRNSFLSAEILLILSILSKKIQHPRPRASFRLFHHEKFDGLVGGNQFEADLTG
jgi:hypothetical protein